MMTRTQNFIGLFFLIPFLTFSQVNSKKVVEKKKDKLQHEAFDGYWLVDNATTTLYRKGTLEFEIQHRFGLINSTNNDLIGIFAPANIRIGANYSFTDNLTLGMGIAKDNRMLDFNTKVAIFRQTRKNTIPVNVTFYGNIAIDTRPQENFITASDKISTFSQLIISRRFSRKLSVQVAPSYSHFNRVDADMNNTHFSMAFGFKYKITDVASILVDYTQPITQHDKFQPKAGLSTGFEFLAGLHVFQVFFTTNRGIVPQKNHMFNQNDIGQTDFAIGFNIIRMWHF